MFGPSRVTARRLVRPPSWPRSPSPCYLVTPAPPQYIHPRESALSSLPRPALAADALRGGAGGLAAIPRAGAKWRLGGEGVQCGGGQCAGHPVEGESREGDLV